MAETNADERTADAEQEHHEESLDETIAKYGSPEFTKALLEAFHRAKRLAIQADLEAKE